MNCFVLQETVYAAKGKKRKKEATEKARKELEKKKAAAEKKKEETARKKAAAAEEAAKKKAEADAQSESLKKSLSSLQKGLDDVKMKLKELADQIGTLKGHINS